MPQEDEDHEWSGALTTTNVEEVAARIRELLTGKKFALVVVEEQFGFKPVLSTMQTLNPENPVMVSWTGEGKERRATLLIHDSKGVTTLTARYPKEGHDQKAEFFAFKRFQVTLQHTVNGNLIYQVYGLEVN